MRAGRREYWIGLAVACLVLSPTLVSLLHRVGHGEGDFSEFREDGAIARSTGRLGEHLPLPYPPTTRPLFMLLSAPPLRPAAVGWWLLSVALYWQVAWWTAARAGLKRATRGSHALAAGTVMALAVVGVVADLTVGQLTALVLFCCVAAFEWSQRGRGVAAGVALAVPLLIKPLPIVLLPYFVLRRRWTTLATCALAWLVLGPLLLTATFGWKNQREGWQHFSADTAGPRSPWAFFRYWEEHSGDIETYKRSGLSSTLVRLFRPVDYSRAGRTVQIATLSAAGLMALWLAIVGLAAALAAWRTWRPGGDVGPAFAVWLGVMLLANPHFISYWLAVPMVPAAYVCAEALLAGAHRDRMLAAICLAVWLLTLVLFAFPACRAAGSVVLGVGATLAGAWRVSVASADGDSGRSPG